jgi:hypothetical protein
MRISQLVPCLVPAILVATGCFAAAQQGGSDWQKTYPIAGKASLSLSTGDASLELRSCGACREIRVRVDFRDRKPDDFNVVEMQSGDHVNFELKEKVHLGIHMSIAHWRAPQVFVETPNALDLDARTSDGSLKVSGVQGNLELHTSDGAVDVADVGGAVRLTASDGAIHIHNLTGTLESRSSDGSATIDGRFSAFHVHASDGRLDVTVAEGSKLTAASVIEGSDGRVTVHLPRTLAADLEVHSSDGKVECALPLTVEGYNSSNGSGHNLRGHLNGGGVPLTIHTSDGNVTISAL